MPSTSKILNYFLLARKLATDFIAGFVAYKYQFNKANRPLAFMLLE